MSDSGLVTSEHNRWANGKQITFLFYSVKNNCKKKTGDILWEPAIIARKQDGVCNWQNLVEWQTDIKLSPSVGLEWHMTLMWENLAEYQSCFQFIKLSI